MDWIRENKPLAAILGVIIAGSLALGYLLFDAWSSYSETRDNYLGLGGQVAGLNGAQLAPTEANLNNKKAQVDQYAGIVNRLGEVLLRLQNLKPVEPIKDIEFQAKLKTKIADVRKAAKSKMQLPAEFAFGFDEYTGSLPVSDAAAAELSNYLDAMDELVKLFMNCGVQSVDLLERSKLPVETQTAPAQNMQGQLVQPILERRQISLILTLDQGALQLLISQLANPSDMPFFTSLRVLRIENARKEGPARSEGNAAAAVTPVDPNAGTQTTAPAADEIRPPDPDPVDSVAIIGEERLKVRMEIDLVKFLNAAQGVAAAAPAVR